MSNDIDTTMLRRWSSDYSHDGPLADALQAAADFIDQTRKPVSDAEVAEIERSHLEHKANEILLDDMTVTGYLAQRILKRECILLTAYRRKVAELAAAQSTIDNLRDFVSPDRHSDLQRELTAAEAVVEEHHEFAAMIDRVVGVFDMTNPEKAKRQLVAALEWLESANYRKVDT